MFTRSPSFTAIASAVITAAVLWSAVGFAAGKDTTPPAGQSIYAKWSNGLDRDTAGFPIAVWLQDPRNAPRYQALGINLYVALWEGPTARQIAELKRHNMQVICDQNDFALKHLDEKIIVGWMHGDEPDNAQSLPDGKGYGPPIPPEKILRDYRKIRANDSSRPVMLNLGQGVAWDGWYGRGARTNHPEDYAEYVRGGDIISFDIYPAVHDKPAIAGKLWYVARGVQRLRSWVGSEQIVWNCIECTRIGNAKATPQQVKAEVWMSIIYGAQGLIYFCHEFQPKFIEAGLLADEEMARAVGAINREVQQLAVVIRTPSVAKAATVKVSPSAVSPDMARLLGAQGIAVAVKKHQGATYLFAVRMDATPAKGAFEMPGIPGGAKVRVIGEKRTIPLRDNRFEDDFTPYAVHLYQIDGADDREVSFVPEMEPFPDMEVTNTVYHWNDTEKTRLADDIRRATEQWKTRIPQLQASITPEQARSLSRWAKTQMEGYRSIPPLERAELRPVGTDANHEKLLLEATIDTLPTHSPLVTRWLKAFLVYDLRTKSISRITVTIRGERLE
jgi:hypothetical protein